MEENQKSVVMSSLMYGIYLSFALIVYSLIMFLLDVAFDSWIKYFSYLIMAGGLFWAMINYRDQQSGGFISYGKAFGTGFWTALFASVVASIFTYVYIVYIDPGMMEEILLKSEESILETNPDMSDEQLEQALSIAESFTSPTMLTIFGFLGSVVFGTILSLIIAIFAKREDPSAMA